mgnify:CR=1
MKSRQNAKTVQVVQVKMLIVVLVAVLVGSGEGGGDGVGGGVEIRVTDGRFVGV